MTLARCNVAACDIPIEVSHIPTIKLYPARQKFPSVEYFGPEDVVAEYVRFINTEKGAEVIKPKSPGGTGPPSPIEQ